MKSLLRLIPYFSRYRAMYLKGFVLVAISSAAQVAWPHFFGTAINDLTSGKATASTLLVQALYIVGFAFISGFFYYLVRQNIIVASRHIEYDIRNDLLAHVERLSMRFFQNTPQGELMAYSTNDVEAVRFFVGPSIMYSADTLATFIAIFGYMLALSPTLALLTVLPLPLMSVAVYFIGRKVHPLFDAVQAHFADLTARTTESISGMRVVRAYVRERYEEGVFNALATGYYDKNMRLVRTQGLMQPIIFAFMGLSTVILLLLGGRMIMHHTLSIGVLSQFVIYLGMLTWPFIALGWVTNMVQRAAASMARLIKLFETEPDIKNSDRTDMRITSLSGAIEFRNVGFRYRPELPAVLEDVSLRIEQGSTLAIIGRTGSGKTTLVDLLARLYDPTTGSITVDGHELRTIPLEVLRGSIGFVTQEPFLFSETIEENIGFGIAGDAHPVHARAQDAAKAADIYDNIMEFPEQFQTMLGERGITLSGGQKQRTAIARAIARNPRILILDDAMSAVDTATEERILSNLRAEPIPRTTVLISHRTSTAKEADLIVVIEHGRIVERGTHAELLEFGGHYYDLYRRQLLEESLETA
ncbi:MAG: ABC transporter ATP-binding protein [Bacteroidota bacterium]|nr:ABC transporter ATP-binding protein [Bacteroidota bacterium]MDP4232685.1 ABC transporter ATP-binding protein [Bacteroidota bacterium]MDP4243182.1 ABC transporter ATP-binding protein [Bacteroidota bacterium]MDP4287639.1 ABC transporter ATP-binding protein [Bacteroidota bacterium]